jgi:hypothetical protein
MKSINVLCTELHCQRGRHDVYISPEVVLGMIFAVVHLPAESSSYIYVDASCYLSCVTMCPVYVCMIQISSAIGNPASSLDQFGFY